jgi:D-alanyl-D-alanine dipeptidase
MFRRTAVFYLLGMAFVFVLGAQEKIQAPSPVLRRVDEALPGMMIDLRYATEHNFTGKVIYANAVAWLRPEVLERLKDVQKSLKKQGYQLVILDAYRPAWAQQKLWDAFPNARFVAHPREGSRHTRGTTVDVTLASATGRLLEMPSGFDEFTKAADHDFSELSAIKRKHGTVLRKAMFAHGFQGVPDEWWHYDLVGWQKFPLIVEKSGD